MYDHIGLRVKDLRNCVRFYSALLAPLGHVPGPQDADYAGFGPPGKPALWLHRAQTGGAGAHVAFRAPDRAAVDRFHAAGIAAGATNNGRPGLRTGYGPTYYAAFLLDPEGNNVEAVCFGED